MMKCPYCGCPHFYFKDPSDDFMAYAFDCESGEICFSKDDDESERPALKDDMQIYCDRCAWNGKLSEIKN